MKITYHKALAENGENIGEEIASGVSSALLPELQAEDLTAGSKITRKIYIKNNSDTDVHFSALSIDNAFSVFPAVLFESSGDAETSDILTGEEGDMSPISVTIPAGEHKSFWLRVDVPTGSTTTSEYNTISIKTIF